MRLNIFQKGFNYSQDGPGNRLVYHLQGCNMHCPWCSNPESISCVGKRMVTMTFTGGEPTLQSEVLKILLEKLKKAGIHTSVETNGTAEGLVDMLPFLDTVMLDFKHYNSGKLKKTAGMGNETVLLHLGLLTGSGIHTIVRIPLIGGFNAGRGDAENFAKTLCDFRADNVHFEFLPYHEYGKDKWKQVSMDYMIENAFVDSETIKFFNMTFEKYGLNIIKT